MSELNQALLGAAVHRLWHDFLSLLIRMIEDYGLSGDNMADRRQLFVEMSKCSQPRPTDIRARLSFSMIVKMQTSSL